MFYIGGAMPWDKDHKDEEWKNKDWTPDTATLRHYTSFDDYVKDFPEGEQFRHWITRDANKYLVIFESRASAFSGPLPGGFYWAFSIDSYINYKGMFIGCRVMVMGCDDGCCEKFIDCDKIANEMEEITTVEHRDFSWFHERGYEFGD